MKHTLFVLAFTLVLSTFGFAADGTPGAQAFERNKCVRCHSVQAAGIAKSGEPDDEEGGQQDRQPPDLSDTGLRHDKVFLAKYLIKQEAIEGRKHKKKFRGSASDLAAIAEWLAEQKTPVRK